MKPRINLVLLRLSLQMYFGNVRYVLTHMLTVIIKIFLFVRVAAVIIKRVLKSKQKEGDL